MSKLENWMIEFAGIVSMWVILCWSTLYLALQAGYTEYHVAVSVGMVATGLAITFVWLIIKCNTEYVNSTIETLKEQIGDQMTDIAIWKQEAKEKNEEVQRLNNIMNPKPESEIPLSPYSHREIHPFGYKDPYKEDRDG